MKRLFWFPFVIFGTGLMLGIVSCQHDPIMPGDGSTPIDTIGGNPDDTTDINTGIPCDPDLVYFDLQILPLLRSNCAKSGCHDDVTHEEGLMMTSYQNVMNGEELVFAFDLTESHLYKAITETDSEERMPPAPDAALTSDQINLIAKWILQGAKNLTCDPDEGQCNTTNVTYSGTVAPILQNACMGCHSGAAPSGGVSLNNYTGVKAQANNGKLFGTIDHSPGFKAMPFGGSRIPQCNIDKIKTWIDSGAPNN